jgi:hypothetical protein
MAKVVKGTDVKEAIAADLAIRNKKVELKATAAHPHRKEGEVFEIHVAHEASVRANGWAVDVSEKNTSAPKNAAKPKASEVTTEANASV